MRQKVFWLFFIGGLWSDSQAQGDHSSYFGIYRIDKIYYDSTLYYDSENDSIVYHYPEKMYRILFGSQALKDTAYLRKQIIIATFKMNEAMKSRVLQFLSDTLLVLPLMDGQEMRNDTVQYFLEDTSGSIYFKQDQLRETYTEMWFARGLLYSSRDKYNCVIWRKNP